MLRDIVILKRRTFFRDVVALATGSAFAQALSFAISPILSRLYSAEDFGVFAIYAFVIAIPSTFVCGCYEAAVVLPKDDNDGRNVVVLSIVIASAMSVIAAVFALLGKDAVRFLNAPALAPWLGCLSIHLFALGVYQPLSYWYNRIGNFYRLAASRMVQSGSAAGVQIVSGSLAIGPGGLVLGQVLGQLFASGFLGGCALRRGDLNAKVALQWSVLKDTLNRYRRFPLYTSWGTLMSVAAFQIVPVLLSRRFGAVEAGSYFFGYRLMSSSISLGTSSIAQVFYQRAALELKEGKSLVGLIEGIIIRLALVSIIPMVVFAVFAPQIFSFVFGPSWMISGIYMRVVMPMFFIQLITSPVSMVLFLLEKQHVASLMQLLLLLGTLSSFTLGEILGTTVMGTIVIYTVAQCIIYLVYLTIIFRLVSSSFVSLLNTVKSGEWMRLRV